MDFNVDTLGPCRKKILVTIPPERVDEEFDKKYGEINDAVAMPGFRPGRAPRKLLERRFSTRLGEEVKNDLVKTALETLFEEKKVEPLAAPDIDLDALDLEPGQALEFTFEVVTKPEFETPDYKGLEVKVPPIEVDKEEIDAAVDQMLRRGATLEAADESKVQAEDVLIVDWKACDCDSVESRDDNAYYPFGRGVLAGFVAASIDEQLDGQAVGTEATATVQVAADDPREELRGRELELRVTLKGIKRYQLPPLDEAFLKKHDYDDEDELREDVRKKIARAKSRQRDGLAEHLLVDQLLGSIEISLPTEFVEQELENWALRKRMSLQMEKIEDEEISKQIDAAREDQQQAIESDMKRHFLLDRVAREESVQVTETEMAHAIEEMAMAYGHPVEQVAAQFRDAGRLTELQSQIRQRKAAEVIRQAAVLVEDATLLKDAAGAAGAKQPPAKADKATKKKASK